MDLLTNIITIQINSEPQIITLSLDETKEIDLDGDNIKDFEIKFEDLYINRAEITLTTLLEDIVDPPNLIKYEHSPKVYLVENNKKRWIIDGNTFLSLGYNWSDITIISNIINYVNGENLQLSTNEFVFSSFLNVGTVGNEVRELQKLLKQLGYFTYPSITGYFGPVTTQAVKDFQRANNIISVGYIGPQTRAALNSK
ncbi:peptidoglycan-binding protein [bacterium]|nr:peptidoglycan-binding protein [bacterium]